MGTKAITKVLDEDGKQLVSLYRQYDGYQDVHGAELKQFLITKELVNGIGSGKSSNELANGMGCLAAQLVANFKTSVGGFYLYAENSAEEWVHFIYTVYHTEDSGKSTISIKVESDEELLFDGLVSDYKAKDVEEEE